jgi:MYXO-CTERM domain-containing protein
MIGIEPIVATLPPLPPDNVFERFYPNVFDPLHPKKFTFTGTVINGSQTAPAFVDLWFDWIDPSDPPPPPVRTSPVFPIDVPPGGTVPVGLPGGPPPIMFTIPFCPPQVSIHIQNNGPGGPVIIEGTFVHECIPEPSTVALGGLALLGLATAGWRRRQ